MTVTRRGFVKAGGALFVSVQFSFVSGARVAAAGGAVDPARLQSWLEIRDDGRIVVRTGRTETGTSASAFFAQVVAEELDVQPAAISLVMGHTDETPDGGYSAGFLSGAENLRKVAAYTRGALLDLAATQLGVPAANLTVEGGVVHGGGRRVSYAELVRGQQLDLKIPVSGKLPTIDEKDPVGITGRGGLVVTGKPPVKAIAQYKVVGQSYERPGIRDIVTGKAQYGGDIVVSGMLHARMVRPATVGSTLVSAGRLDRAMFPGAEVVTRGNFVAVVAPNEWEAVQAAQAVAAATKWTSWEGLPPSANVLQALRAAKWLAGGTRGDAAKTGAGLKGAAKVVSSTYEHSYMRHAPMGAYVSVADVKSDGTITVWSQTSQSQGARAHIAHMMGVPADNVVIRWAQGPGQYGRTTYGGDGAMADAVILSKLVGKPVRVQWTLAEDLAWSSCSPAWYADVKVGLDAAGNMVAFTSDWYSPHSNDARMLGAVLAGMPTTTPSHKAAYPMIHTSWLYGKAPAFEQAFFMENLAADAASGGLRGNIMRTPWQREQNTALEGIISEAAAAAGADPIEFRRRHSTNKIYIGLLDAVAKAHGWVARPSPSPSARRTGSTPVKGRGVGVVNRGAPWVCIAEVEVTPSTGVVKLTALTVGVDVGKVMNPRHLTSMLEGGTVMGVSEAMFEEMSFDASRVTSTDWSKYRIARMADIPAIKTVFASRDDGGIDGGGEAANAAAPAAIMAAVFDATGVMPRRIPLTPAYVKARLAEAY